MADAVQMAFPFASLDFPGRTMITLAEMAEKLGCSNDHLLNEAERGALCGVDLKGARASRRNIMVPIESYRAYVLTRLTVQFRADFVRHLPRAVLLQLQAEIKAALPTAV